MPPPHKKKKLRGGKFHHPLHDEILFANDEQLFQLRNVDLSSLRNVYCRGRGDDRLYFPADDDQQQQQQQHLYAHINPHLYAWHNNVPSEVMYGSLAKYALHPIIKNWWLTTTTETVVIYERQGGGSIVPSTSLNTSATAGAAARKLFEACKKSLVETAIFPTCFHPTRIHYCPERDEMAFYEAGHFQNTAWLVNESVRIVDAVYGHPTLEHYFPVNAFKTREDVFSESLVSGLLNFFHGTVTFFYFCLHGSDPVRNSKKNNKRMMKESTSSTTTTSCSNRLGICESIVDERRRNFFHEFYCVQTIKLLPMLLKKKASAAEHVGEFVRRYDALLEAIDRLDYT